MSRPEPMKVYIVFERWGAIKGVYAVEEDADQSIMYRPGWYVESFEVIE